VGEVAHAAPGDDRVVVLAEKILQILRTRDELRGLLATGVGGSSAA
jgi:hypothetical protein